MDIEKNTASTEVLQDIFTIIIVIMGFSIASYSQWMGAVSLTLTVIWLIYKLFSTISSDIRNRKEKRTKKNKKE